MKVLLINPPSPDLKFIREGRCEQRADSYQYLMVPISLPSIAAVLLQKNYDVKIYDCTADNISYEELKNILQEEKPTLAIVNIATPSYYNDIETATLCKELKILSIAIGVHVTTLPEETLKNSNFNIAIRGEPEITALDLVESIKNSKSLSEVKGISYKSYNEVKHNPDREVIEDLDSLPFPARNLLHNEKYLGPTIDRPYTLLIASRGCPHSCIFCIAHHYYGKKIRYRTPKNIAEEIKLIVKENNIRDIAMWSDTFTFNKEWILELCEEIIKTGLDINWYCNSRVDTIDEDRIKAMAASGCKVITFGVETLDENILKNIKKNTTLEQVENAIKLCKKYKIKSQVHMIFGLPGETKKTIKQTLKKLLKINPDYAQFYIALPFPGTEFYEYAKTNNILLTTDYSKYEINQAIISYPHLTDKDLKNAMKRAYRKFYFRPTYLVKKLKEFPIKQWPSLTMQSYNLMKNWVFNKD